MTTFARLAEWRHKKLVENTMDYPAEVQPNNEWYMTTPPSAAKDGTNEFTSAYIIFKCVGHKDTWYDFKSVRLDDPDFVNKWKALIAEAKIRIDALNAQPQELSTCAECSEPTIPGDYLCQACRE